MKLSIIKTNNFNSWTQHKARDMGIKKAVGNKLISLDIDHIATKQLLEFVLNCDYDVVKFRRKLGILDENGDLQINRKIMVKYGALKANIAKHGRKIPPPGNVFAITKKLFLSTKKKSGKFWHIIKRMKKKGEIRFCKTDERPLVYMFPIGRYCGNVDADPLQLFHGLSRKTKEYQDAEKECGAR